MFEISVRTWFSAAHQLRLSGGMLEPLHGHNWHVEVTFRGPALDGMGVLLDFTKIKPRLDAIAAGLHDRNLNDLPPFAECNPSAENVALHIAEQLGRDLPAEIALSCVAVEESPGCVARWCAS
jgi:6-pyruvoyltetrahydropterin/6-carboxytetrahydropterin synthase